MNRSSRIERNTNETQIQLTLNLDGSGIANIDTGVGFLDHMLDLFTKHSLIDLSIKAQGDLHIDAHHTTEDIGICLGLAIEEAVGDKSGIHRFGHFTLPMDETLVTTAIDLGGRPCLEFRVNFPTSKMGDFDTELVEEFWNAVSSNARCNIHVLQHHGRNSHHISEAVFKALARSLRMAVEVDPRQAGVPSTKGSL